ncbi:hypothetical protein [Paraburkholderia strydomiana]
MMHSGDAADAAYLAQSLRLWLLPETISTPASNGPHGIWRASGSTWYDAYGQVVSIENLFFRDVSSEMITDDVFQRLVSFPNVIVTGLQAYLTHEALTTICETTLQSVSAFEKNLPLQDDVDFE